MIMIEFGKQAAAELGQAQPQLGLELTSAALGPIGLCFGQRRGSKTTMNPVVT